MVRPVFWTELTDMQCTYGAQTVSRRQASLLYFICVPSVTFPAGNNNDILLISVLCPTLTFSKMLDI